MFDIPDPNTVFPNEYKTSCFLKTSLPPPNIHVGDYTYYDDLEHPTEFQQRNVLFNYPEFGDQLIIGKFCAIAAGTKFIMGPPTTGPPPSPPSPPAGVGGGGPPPPPPPSPAPGRLGEGRGGGGAGASPPASLGGACLRGHPETCPTPWPGATPAPAPEAPV